MVQLFLLQITFAYDFVRFSPSRVCALHLWKVGNPGVACDLTLRAGRGDVAIQLAFHVHPFNNLELAGFTISAIICKIKGKSLKKFSSPDTNII